LILPLAVSRGSEAPKGANFIGSAQHRHMLPCAGTSGADSRRRQVYAICATHLLAGRARLPALRSGSRHNLHIVAQLQARFPGTWFRRALPALACPSPVTAPHAPAVIPANMMPKAARERFAKPRAGAAPRSTLRIASGRRPRMSKTAPSQHNRRHCVKPFVAIPATNCCCGDRAGCGIQRL
jgi:hypothetical protein